MSSGSCWLCLVMLCVAICLKDRNRIESEHLSTMQEMKTKCRRDVEEVREQLALERAEAEKSWARKMEEAQQMWLQDRLDLDTQWEARLEVAQQQGERRFQALRCKLEDKIQSLISHLVAVVEKDAHIEGSRSCYSGSQDISPVKRPTSSKSSMRVDPDSCTASLFSEMGQQSFSGRHQWAKR